MSLRARLVITLLALAAAGLITLAGITYATQRSYQLERIDEQARLAVPSMGFQLDAQAGGVNTGSEGPPGGRGPGGRPATVLPAGTYGERRDASGDVTGRVAVSYGQTASAAPRLPATLSPDSTVTVKAQSGGLSYRVRAVREPGGGLLVVALPLSGVQDTLSRLLVVEALVVAGILLLLAAGSWLLVRAELRPLERIGRTADDIAAGELSRRVEVGSPTTEVGRLGLALNGMLERLEQAFAEREASEERLRRFLSDASHELRTPLASIRGYAELTRLGAAGTDEERARALRRIEDEATRMGILVEDLLTLARLDETREPVTRTVDLALLAADAVADARAADPARPIDLEVCGTAEVMGDPDSLRQVLVNLVGNALSHTGPGTPVEVAVAREDDEVVLVVRDHGPGLPGGDAQELFTRFWRAEGGRERGRAGAELGLAIVDGVVGAHGGSVAADDAPGGGARFTVRLPASAPVREPEPLVA